MRNQNLNPKNSNANVRAISDSLGEKVNRRKLVDSFQHYLRQECGLDARSIPGRLWNVIDRFLKFRFAGGAGDLSRITPDDIVRFLEKMQSAEHPSRVTLAATHLRRFFRFLLKVGELKTDLALIVPRIAGRNRQKLPRHLPPEQVDALLAAVRADTPIGRRNYAMMLVLARLGLRPQEVVAMQIDDIDWRAGEILIRGKGQRWERVPLPQEVGEALTAYIRSGRVTESRALFVSSKAPGVPFKRAIILNTILQKAYRKTGLKTPSPNVGSSVLRHSLATNLVQRGASLQEIANLLRHRSWATTMQYAKLDIDGLRSIAQSWPVKGGAK